MSSSELPSYESAARPTRLPDFKRPLAALANPFARDSRPSSPVPSEQGDVATDLVKKNSRQRPTGINRKYLEQAQRLFGETLQEDLASNYAFDLHFSALDYSLRAIQLESFDDAPARKANIRRRLGKLLEQVGSDTTPAHPPQDARWWQHPGLPFGGQPAAPPMSTPGADGSFELLGNCPSCASRVPVLVPGWMTKGDAVKKAPATWEELAVGAVVGLAVMIKQSPIPLIITSFFTAIMQAMLYLDDRFEVHQRFLLLLGGVIEAFVVLDRELGVLRKCGDLLHKLWEIGISAMLAFARAEGYNAPPRAGPHAQPLPPSGSARTSPDLGTAYSTAAPMPRRQISNQGHTARNSWPNNKDGLAPLASSSSNASNWRGLRSPASYDTLRGPSNDSIHADADEGHPQTRRREDSWTGRALNLVPGRRV